jgi:hypothetical protein
MNPFGPNFSTYIDMQKKYCVQHIMKVLTSCILEMFWIWIVKLKVA